MVAIGSLSVTERRALRVAVWLGAWLVASCAPAHAIDRDRRIEELRHTAWSYSEGAPGEVHALAQTTDGYLWVGTAAGLFHFDGIRFVPYTPRSRTFRQRSIASLFASPDGGLWVGYTYGGVSVIKDGAVTDYGASDGLPSRGVLAFARDRHGVIWIAAEQDGLARLDGGRWQPVGREWGFAGLAYTVFVDRAGTLWAGTATSVVSLAEGDRRFQLEADGLQRVRHLAEAEDGTLWMAELGHGVRPVPLPGKSPAAVLVGSHAIAFDDQGSLWVTSVGTGVRRVPYPERLRQEQAPGPSAWQFRSANVQAFTQEHGLTSDYVSAVLRDREGNVWVGTSAGLDRFRQSPVVPVPLQPLPERGGPPIPSQRSFVTSAVAAHPGGGLWASGLGPQVLVRIEDDGIATQLRDQPVDAVHRDPGGALWFATPYSLFRVADERRLRDEVSGAVRYVSGSGVPVGRDLTLRRVELPAAGSIAVSLQSRVKAITRDHSGRLWLAMGAGTYRLDRGEWTSLESLGGPAGTATAAFTEANGRLWFGFANAVVVLDGEQVTTWSREDGVQVGAVTSILSHGGRIWIGGEFGLAVVDGRRLQALTPSHGPAFANVSGLVDTDDGLWFADTRGIVHIRGNQLRQPGPAEVEVESYGSLDGLTTELRGSLSSPSATRTDDGRIWFATAKGLAWIDPQRSPRNTVPPPVAIEAVVADGTLLEDTTRARLPARTANLRIDYTATSLAVPERVRFRYMLEGQDKDWQDAGTRREAFYTNLGPGAYQFRVIACNNDGVWNTTGASLMFSIAPAYYQTAWFRAAVLAVALGVLWLLYQRRLGQLAHDFNLRLDERVHERTRIARELHDTLLQSFQGLIFRFHSVRDLLPGEPARAIDALEGALDRADQAIVEGRDAIQNLRSSTTVGNELAQAIAALAEELTADPGSAQAPAAFNLTVEGTPRDLHPIVRDDIHRIAREALRNAFRHARADHIEAEVTYAAHEVRLRIRDDGVGMNQQHLTGGRARHWGLASMRERAEQIGATLSLWSEPGAGTEVELRIPGGVAYGASGREKLLRRLRRRGAV